MTNGTAQAKKDDKNSNMAWLFKEDLKNLNDYNVENAFLEILRQYYFEGDHNIELELKKFNSNNHIDFFFVRFKLIPKEKLNKIVQVFAEKDVKFIDIIQKTIVEIVPFLKLVTRFMDVTIKSNSFSETFVETAFKVCEAIEEFDSSKCELCFFGFGLPVLLDFLRDHPDQRDIVVSFIFKLIKKETYSFNALLRHIKEYYQKDELLFYHLAVKIQLYHKEIDIDDVAFDFYKEMVTTGLHSSSEIIVIKSLKILCGIADLEPSLMAQLESRISKLVASWNWEVLSSVLIFAYFFLLILNSYKKKIINLSERLEEVENQEEKAEITEEIALSEQHVDFIKDYEQNYLDLIKQIFDFKSPLLTMKVGFIYLAKILQFYPDLAEKYMQMLIEFEHGKIRAEVLDVQYENYEQKYTANWFSESYLISGAPNQWNAIVVAGLFRDYILKKEEEFDLIHLKIFYSIVLNHEFGEEGKDEWIAIFKDLKTYLYFSLCSEEFSEISLHILKKFYSFAPIVENILEVTKDSFLEAMSVIYGKRLIKCKENMLNLLTFISFESNCKSYVYRLLKEFAIANNELYLTSNLLELMNDIYKGERGLIFPDETEEDDREE